MKICIFGLFWVIFKGIKGD